MRGKKLAIGLRATLAIAAVLLFVTGTRAASQEKVLHSFNAIEFGTSSAVQSVLPEGSPGPTRPANKTAHPAKSAIRSVDFRNFDYPASCFYADNRFGYGDNSFGKVIHVKNGEWDWKPLGFEPSGPKAEIADYFQVDDVVYGDLKGDGREEAVVLTSCDQSHSPDPPQELFVFEMSAKGPQLLADLSPSAWRQGEGFASDGNLYGLHISDRKLIVSFPGGELDCWPAWIITAELEWNGKQFTRNGNIGLSIGPGGGCQLISGEAKMPWLRVECRQKDDKTEHQMILSPDGPLVYYSPEFVARGGQATFTMTIGGGKQATTWIANVEKVHEVRFDWRMATVPKAPYDIVNFTYSAATEAERWKFIQSVLDSGSVSVAFTPVNGKPVTTVFDVSRLREGIEKHPQCAAK